MTKAKEHYFERVDWIKKLQRLNGEAKCEVIYGLPPDRYDAYRSLFADIDDALDQLRRFLDEDLQKVA